MALINAVGHIAFGASHHGRDRFQQESRSKSGTFEDLVREHLRPVDAMPPSSLSIEEYVRTAETQLRILKGDGSQNQEFTEPVPSHYDQIHDAHAPQVVDLVV